MRLLRLPVLAFLLASSLLLPSGAFAQGAGSMFDPIIPEACKCASVPVIGADGNPTGQTSPSAANWGCVLLVLQNVINTAVGIAVLVVILAIVYAGFVFMTSGGSPERRTQGRNVLANSIIGLLILLDAWLGVDFVMKVVYNPNAVFSGSTQLGPWNAIWSSSGDDMCLVVREPVPITTGSLSILTGSPGGLPQIGRAGALCADSNPACSVQALMNEGLTEVQARAMSCIAVTESSGNPNTPQSSTGACGTFQITTRPGNWSIPAFHGPGCSVNTPCNNARCNLQTAVLMFRARGYQPWTGVDPRTGKHWNPNAVACVNKYDPGR